MPWEADNLIIRSCDCFLWYLHHNTFNLVERISWNYLVKVINATCSKKNPRISIQLQITLRTCHLHVYVVITKIARLPYLGIQVTQKCNKTVQIGENLAYIYASNHLARPTSVENTVLLPIPIDCRPCAFCSWIRTIVQMYWCTCKYLRESFSLDVAFFESVHTSGDFSFSFSLGFTRFSWHNLQQL